MVPRAMPSAAQIGGGGVDDMQEGHAGGPAIGRTRHGRCCRDGDGAATGLSQADDAAQQPWQRVGPGSGQAGDPSGCGIRPEDRREYGPGRGRPGSAGSGAA